MSVDDLKLEIVEGWADRPAATVALQLIEFMRSLRDQELRMLTIPLLLEATDREEVDQDFLAALAILVSSTVHILDAKAFLWQGEDSQVHINAEALAAARRDGSLENPETGELIEDFESRLIPYFESSERFLRALTNV